MKVLVVTLAILAWCSVWGLLERRLYGRATLGGFDLLGTLVEILARVF